MSELARRYNSLNYLLSGSNVSESEALRSIAGTELRERMLLQFLYERQNERFFSFYNTSNSVSEIIEKAYQNFERVFSANDKQFEVFDIREGTLLQIRKTVSSFESQALPELKQNNTVYVAIVSKEDCFELLFLPVDLNFSIKKDKESGEIVSYNYSNYIKVELAGVTIKDEFYPNSTEIFPIFKLIEKEVKPAVSWSPTFGYLGSLKQLLVDLIMIEWQKVLTQSVAVTAEYSCGYTEGSEKCDSGHIYSIVDGRRTPKPCPGCAMGIGPGQTLVVKPKVGEKADLDSALKFVNPDSNSLEENVARFDQRRVEIYEGMTGLRYSIETNSSYENKSRITSDFEKAKTIHTTLAKEFTRCEAFISMFITLSLEGKIPESNISLGNDFYLITKEDLIIQLGEAKKNGLPQFIINDILYRISEMEFKDVSRIEEYKIWTALEPYAGYSVDEIKGIASAEDIELKTNFITLMSSVFSDMGVASAHEYMSETGKSRAEVIKTIKELLNIKTNKNGEIIEES